MIAITPANPNAETSLASGRADTFTIRLMKMWSRASVHSEKCYNTAIPVAKLSTFFLDPSFPDNVGMNEHSALAELATGYKVY